jgi:hypothetical protein
MEAPPLTLVVCGAPLAARAPELAGELRSRWNVSLVVTEAARHWCAWPSDEDRPRPQTVIACPLTFNTANKVAAGIMDGTAPGVLCDALGAGVPIVAVPMVNDRLWGPVWPSTIRTLSAAGVRFVDPRSGRIGAPEPVSSGTGPEVVAAFRPSWVTGAVA